MTAIEFYEITKNTLEELSGRQGIEELEKYYELTDFKAFPQLKNLGEIEQTYMQIAFHGQNATLISNIVKFKDNYNTIKDVLCNFNPKSVLEKYSSTKELLEEFNNNGISANLEKSKKRKNAIMEGYADMLLNAARYLEQFDSKEKIIKDLKNNYQNKDIEKLIKYFRNKIKSRFSIALTCDFLKEYSTEFDLPKPDIHIKDALRAYKGKADNYYNTQKGEYECIKDMQELTAEINNTLKAKKQNPITVYQLDRMIWLVCSNKFFLDETISKKDYLSKIKAKVKT